MYGILKSGTVWDIKVRNYIGNINVSHTMEYWSAWHRVWDIYILCSDVIRQDLDMYSAV